MAAPLVDALLGVLGLLRVVAALVLVFVLPGLLLVNVLYPRRGELDREYDALYRLTLGIVLSIAVTGLWGFFLNSLGVQPGGVVGYVQAPEIAAGLTAKGHPSTVEDFHASDRIGKARLDEWLWPQLRDGQVPRQVDPYYWRQ